MHGLCKTIPITREICNPLAEVVVPEHHSRISDNWVAFPRWSESPRWSRSSTSAVGVECDILVHCRNHGVSAIASPLPEGNHEASGKLSSHSSPHRKRGIQSIDSLSNVHNSRIHSSATKHPSELSLKNSRRFVKNGRNLLLCEDSLYSIRPYRYRQQTPIQMLSESPVKSKSVIRRT